MHVAPRKTKEDAAETNAVKEATSTLHTNVYTSPHALIVLLQIVTSKRPQELRQLAAVEARKLIPKHWAKLPAEQRAAARSNLLQSSLDEENTLVRHSSARVISAIAKLDLGDGEGNWPDLPKLLLQAATSQSVRHREVGIYIIFTLFETMGDMFSENISDILTLFSRTIKDPESINVRINTMLALSRAAMTLDPEEDQKALSIFQGLIPSMVNILQETIQAGDDDHVMQCFEVFQTLLGCDAALLQTHFGDLIQFMINIAAETEADDETRSQAISFLMQCVKYRKLKVQALKVGEQLTIKSLQIVTELGGESSEDEDITPARAALGLLDTLASSLPPSQVLVPLLKALGSYFSSPDPDYRRA